MSEVPTGPMRGAPEGSADARVHVVGSQLRAARASVAIVMRQRSPRRDTATKRGGQRTSVPRVASVAPILPPPTAGNEKAPTEELPRPFR